MTNNLPTVPPAASSCEFGQNRVRSFPGPHDRFAQGTIIHGKNAPCIFPHHIWLSLPVPAPAPTRSYRCLAEAVWGRSLYRTRDSRVGRDVAVNPWGSRPKGHSLDGLTSG